MISVHEIAVAWINKWQGENPLALDDKYDEPEFDLEHGTTSKNPDLCLDVIHELLSLIDLESDGRIFSVLAAGRASLGQPDQFLVYDSFKWSESVPTAIAKAMDRFQASSARKLL